jgi:hypothetical protein
LTLVSRNWIELTLGIDPDRHAGWLEWSLVAASAGATVVFAAGARHEWRRTSLRARTGVMTGG